MDASNNPKQLANAIVEEWNNELKYEGFLFAALKRFGLVEGDKSYVSIPKSDVFAK